RNPGSAGAGARELVGLGGCFCVLVGAADRARGGTRSGGARRDTHSPLGARCEGEVLAPVVLPGADRGAARRALLFDLRNLGTLGLQQDSFPGLMWADAIYGHAQLSPAEPAALPATSAAAAV